MVAVVEAYANDLARTSEGGAEADVVGDKRGGDGGGGDGTCSLDETSLWTSKVCALTPKSVNEMVVGWHDKQFVWRKHGVCIHTPPEGKQPISGDQIKPAVPGASPYAGGRLDQTVYIELIIDGEIVDLNRIQLPADTPIIDERFAEPANK